MNDKNTETPPEIVEQMNEMLKPKPREPLELKIDVFMCKACERIHQIAPPEECGCKYGNGAYWKGTATFLRNL